jgi:hypothetical protein
MSYMPFTSPLMPQERAVSFREVWPQLTRGEVEPLGSRS